MTTSEIINTVCADLGISKAALAKRLGMFPSSLYRKLERESMPLEELQKCLDLLGVTIAFELRYTDGGTRRSEENHAMLLEKLELVSRELDAAKKTSEFQRKSFRELRAGLTSALGYAELGEKHSMKAEEYLERIRSILGTMDLTIACALGEEPRTESDPEEPVDLAFLVGKRVLLVDDNVLNREILKEVLTDHGLLVEEADSGSNAILAVKNSEPGYYQCVFMDIEMPDMDGYKATIQIRKLPNRIRANTPIVALTANAVHENRERAYAVGMDDFLVKPVSTPYLLRSLEKLLR